MPLLDMDDPALWDGGPKSFYRSYRQGDKPLGFVRAVKDEYRVGPLPQLMAALQDKGLGALSKIVILGGAFGWTAEELIDLGYSNVVNVDTSRWIHANKHVHARLPVLNEDILTDAGRHNVRELFASHTVDWCITEDVLPCLSNSEVTALCMALHALTARTLHIVSVGPFNDKRLNDKTLEQWKALVNPDYVVRRGAVELL